MQNYITPDSDLRSPHSWLEANVVRLRGRGKWSQKREVTIFGGLYFEIEHNFSDCSDMCVVALRGKSFRALNGVFQTKNDRTGLLMTCLFASLLHSRLCFPMEDRHPIATNFGTLLDFVIF